jgi:hypothetical protein
VDVARRLRRRRRSHGKLSKPTDRVYRRRGRTGRLEKPKEYPGNFGVLGHVGDDKMEPRDNFSETTCAQILNQACE